MVLLKFAIGFFLLRVTSSRWQRHVMYGTFVVSTLFGLGYFLLAALQCGVNFNGTSFWMKVVSGQCLRGQYTLAFGYAHATITVLTDIIFVTLPIAILKRAKLGFRSTLMVYGILAIGGVYVYRRWLSLVLAMLTSYSGCVASIIRVPWLKYLNNISPSFFRK